LHGLGGIKGGEVEGDLFLVVGFSRSIAEVPQKLIRLLIMYVQAPGIARVRVLHLCGRIVF